jgi:hypothetical protein
LVLGCLVAGAQTASLKAVPLSDTANLANRIPKGLLPSHSSRVSVVQKQVFSLVAAGQPDLLLVPVKFWHDETAQMDPDHMLMPEDRCGLFVMPKGGTASFVWTDTSDSTIGLCGGVQAIGMMPQEGARPRLILIYRTYSPPQQKYVATFVLAWDAAKGTFTVEQKATDYLNNGPDEGKMTVAGAKAALARQGR